MGRYAGSGNRSRIADCSRIPVLSQVPWGSRDRTSVSVFTRALSGITVKTTCRPDFRISLVSLVSCRIPCRSSAPAPVQNMSKLSP